MNNTGCASVTISTSEFFTNKFEEKLQNSFLVNVNVTEEGTGELLADLNQWLVVWCLYVCGVSVSSQMYWCQNPQQCPLRLKLARSCFWTSQISLTMDQSLTERQAKLHFLDRLHWFLFLTFLSQQISASSFNGTPIARKAVYLLDSSQWPNKLLQNLTTNLNGVASFSLKTTDFPKADLNLLVWLACFFFFFLRLLLQETNSI